MAKQRREMICPDWCWAWNRFSLSDGGCSSSIYSVTEHGQSVCVRVLCKLKLKLGRLFKLGKP